jgi:6-pyruvoyltetrahydropterin/6-carboxytetrahydropterin synthase
MLHEVTQRFFFEAAHTLRREIETESSRRIHGHTYCAEVTIAGEQDPASGMVVDLGILRARIATLREQLDHRFLDEVEGLTHPTLEGLCNFIVQRLDLSGMPGRLARVRVWREQMGDGCTLTLPTAPGPSVSS